MTQPNGDDAFPQLVSLLDTGPGSSTQGDGDPGRDVDRTIGDVLGWRWRPKDTKSFLAALDGSFTVKAVEGHNEVEYHPRGFAVQADLGAVTGGQASLAARARNTVQQVRPLIDSLRALDPAANLQDAEAFRGLLRYALDELLAELESPVLRPERIDILFEVVVGDSTQGGRSGKVGGHLGRMADSFGISGGNTNSIEDERILTSVITIQDYLLGLRDSWIAQRDKFDPLNHPGGFLGATLILLSAQLESVWRQAEELEKMFETVLVDRAERQVRRLPGSSLTIDGLLTWIRSFAADEGKKIVDLGGKDAVESAFAATATALRDLVESKLLASTPTNKEILQAPRVHQAVLSLRDQLDLVVKLALGIRRAGVWIACVESNALATTGKLVVVVVGFEKPVHSFRLKIQGAPLKPLASADLGSGRWEITFNPGDIIAAIQTGHSSGMLRLRLKRDGRTLDETPVDLLPPPPGGGSGGPPGGGNGAGSSGGYGPSRPGSSRPLTPEAGDAAEVQRIIELIRDSGPDVADALVGPVLQLIHQIRTGMDHDRSGGLRRGDGPSTEDPELDESSGGASADVRWDDEPEEIETLTADLEPDPFPVRHDDEEQSADPLAQGAQTDDTAAPTDPDFTADTRSRPGDIPRDEGPGDGSTS
ncbi:hypothetical protein ACQPX6_03070 [Actinomycetospora sp. CA-101289]|uniref:hypothetical protein n=1 Tax=Actinomycetospora sp. CA-101289 TaxID=3239893 RepID=UPI003D9992C3